MTTQRRTKYKGAEKETTVKLKPLQAFNANQKPYFKALKEATQIIITGYSVTGKTYMAKTHNLPIPTIEFGMDDIVRSDICKQWIVAFDKEEL